MGGFAQREREEGDGLAGTIATFTRICKQHARGEMPDDAFLTARQTYEDILPNGTIAVAAIHQGVVDEMAASTGVPSPGTQPPSTRPLLSRGG